MKIKFKYMNWEASKATAKGLEAEYAETKVAYEKNHKSTTKK